MHAPNSCIDAQTDVDDDREWRAQRMCIPTIVPPIQVDHSIQVEVAKPDIHIASLGDMARDELLPSALPGLLAILC